MAFRWQILKKTAQESKPKLYSPHHILRCLFTSVSSSSATSPFANSDGPPQILDKAVSRTLNIVEGKTQYLYDEKGRRYLVAFVGIVTVSYGHCHPHVLEAIIEKTKLLQHATTIYLHHTIADFAEALAAKMPGNLKDIGNGLLLGAIVTTPEIASVMAQKIQFNTFGGNHVCSAGGLAVLRVIDQEKHQDHCTVVGSHLLGRLRDRQQRYDSNISLTSHSK